MNTLIKSVLHEGRKCNIYFEAGRFTRIEEVTDGNRDAADAPDVIDGDGLAILPSFFNAHTHAAMSILRGYADDIALDSWLNDYIWPRESRMDDADFIEGNNLAVEEMAAGGTTFFNDMYFSIQHTFDAVSKSGLRAAIGLTVMDIHPQARAEELRRLVREFKDPTGGRIQLVIAPHAIYTVSAENFRTWSAFARDNGLKFHTHLSETQFEVDNCMREHGLTPVQYLDSLGVLGPEVVAAHLCVINEKDADILAERGVTVVHCPCSNMKLSSGVMPYKLMKKAGVKVALGTDGACSGNNLDMREAMKFAALLAKSNGNPEDLSAEEVLQWATIRGADAFGIDGGVVAVGKVADFILVDLGNVRMRPCYNLVSNWVYSADTSCIKDVFCNGVSVR